MGLLGAFLPGEASQTPAAHNRTVVVKERAPEQFHNPVRVKHQLPPAPATLLQGTQCPGHFGSLQKGAKQHQQDGRAARQKSQV